MSPERKRQVLFVDDEELVLEAIRRVLKPHPMQWEVTTTTSPLAALGLMDRQKFDVIVSDLRMPEMDGATFLANAKAKSPATARIILSGQADKDDALRTVGVAHQFLSKPADAALLLETLKRVASTHDDLRDPELLAAVGALSALPTIPRLCQRLTTLVSADDITIKELVAAIEPEPAVVLKLLQLVNSAFFGLRRQLSNVTEAVTYLGTELIRNLVVSVSIVNSLPVRARSFDPDAFQRRSVTIAQLARLVGGRGDAGDTAFVAGMLHDVGKLTLAFSMPARYDAIAFGARVGKRTFEEEEAVAGGCGHRKIAGYLLRLWGLPTGVVDAIAEEPHVHEYDHDTVRAPDALHLALRLADAPNLLETDESERVYLARLGVYDRVPSWRRRAAELMGREARLVA